MIDNRCKDDRLSLAFKKLVMGCPTPESLDDALAIVSMHARVTFDPAEVEMVKLHRWPGRRTFSDDRPPQ